MQAEFQQALDSTLFILERVLTFLYDILKLSKGTEEDHMRQVDKVLGGMKKVGIATKLNKNNLAQNKIEWLVHKITQCGNIPLQSKLETFQKQTALENSSNYDGQWEPNIN